ncbi:MAG: amphi-Trp domain-containing protein [Thermodesulfovibrio sp.]|nr:amphi-Trp domain-containing protein [Thermodesulfovibrio sp.]
MSKKSGRDISKNCSQGEFVRKLRRIADAVEKGRGFEIQIAGERISVPAGAEFSIEHEREGVNEEIEFQITWTRA